MSDDKKKEEKIKEFNLRKIEHKLVDLEGLIKGYDIKIRQLIFKDEEQQDKDRFIKEFIEGLIDEYKSDNSILYEMLVEDEMTFLRSFLQCSIRIALYEEKCNVRKVATFGSILRDANSLEYIYKLPYILYERLVDDDIKNKTYYKPTKRSKEFMDELRYMPSFRYFDFFQYKQDELNILDKVNLYYWYLKQGLIPVFTKIEEYKDKDSEHYERLKKRADIIKSEFKTANEIFEEKKKEEERPELIYYDEEDEEIEKAREEYENSPEYVEQMEKYFEQVYGEDYENNPDFIWEQECARISFEEEEEKREKEEEEKRKEEEKAKNENFILDVSFDCEESFLKNCELFRFYLNTERNIAWSGITQSGYPRIKDKIERAIKKYISKHDLCGFRNTDKSAYIYMLLAQAKEIIEKEIKGNTDSNK